MRVVIAGECNSGKTWLANGLLGSQVLPTSFVTRTELPTVVEFGASSRLVLERHDGSRVATTWEECGVRGQPGPAPVPPAAVRRG